MLGRRKPTVVSRRVDFAPRQTRFNRWKFRRVDRVICVSQCIGKILINWGLPPEQVGVVYSTVPGDTYLTPEASRKLLCEKTGVRPDQKIIGNIAALVGHKDHETLLKAASLLLPRRPDAAFIVVGEGDLKERLLRQRDELNLKGAVHFAGYIPQAQRLLPGFDVLAMSSCMEGLGTTVLDAGMAGRAGGGHRGRGVARNRVA